MGFLHNLALFSVKMAASTDILDNASLGRQTKHNPITCIAAFVDKKGWCLNKRLPIYSLFIHYTCLVEVLRKVML